MSHLRVKKDLRVKKERAAATITLSNGAVARGSVFVSGFSALHSGPETIKDLLNNGGTFFPFEVTESGTLLTRLYNREHVVFVRLPTDHEVREDPEYDVSDRRAVSVLLSTGERLNGFVRVARPMGRDRLSDHARFCDRFWYFETPDAAIIVNASHVLELMELNEQ
jgi:hypothetical protein